MQILEESMHFVRNTREVFEFLFDVIRRKSRMLLTTSPSFLVIPKSLTLNE